MDAVSLWHRTRVVTGLAVSVLLIGGLLAGAAIAQDESPSPESDEKVVFTWGDTSEPSSFNPMIGYLATDFYFWAASYHLLTDFAIEDLGARPGLAEEIEVSDDGLTFTYHIRQGLKWSVGEDLTAEDVAFTLNLYKERKAYLPQNYLTLIDGDVRVVDDYTIQFDTTQPTSLYSGDIPYMYDYILPEHIWSEFDTPKSFENVPNVGSGPFVIAEYKTGEFVRMERNPFWTGPEPAVDELIYRIFKNEDAEAEALKAGEIDFAYIDSANIFNSLQGQPNIETLVGTIPAFDEIGMNTGSSLQPEAPGYTPHGDGHPALADPVVRRAIRMSIDSQELVDKVLLGYGIPGTSIIPPVSVAGARWEPSQEELLAFDLEAANQLLDDAGYVDTDDDGVREMPGGGQPLEFRYYVQTNDQNTVKTAPFVRSWLEQIGIKAEVTSMNSGRLGDEINAGTYDLFHWGWIPDPDPDSALSWFTCGQRPPDGKSYGNNDSYYCNAEYDRMYDEQRTTTDTEERWSIVHEMQRMFYNDAAYSVLWYSPIFQAYRTDTFTGYMPQPSPEGDLLAGYSMDVFYSLRPVGAEGGGDGGVTGTTTRGLSALTWILIAAGVIVVVGAVVLVRRRSAGDEDAA